jgi:hypothetical protein
MTADDHELSDLTQPTSGRSFYALAALIAITVAAIALRIYKGAHTGMIYDEAYSMLHFTDSYKDALTLYLNPNNNHVLNSLMMVFGRLHLPAFDWSFRAHTIAFGILYCISISYLVWVLIDGAIFRILLASLLLFQWFVFDLSYLARGYSIALGAIYAGLAVLILCLERKLPARCIWLPIATLVAINFFALGSMLSALTTVFTLTACYIAFFSHHALEGQRSRPRTVLIHLSAVTLCSVGLLYLLYMSLWRDIIGARGRFSVYSLGHHIKDVMWLSILGSAGMLGTVAYIVFLALVLAAITRWLYLVITRSSAIRPVSKGRMLVILTAVSLIVVIIVYKEVLRQSLGYARNGVFVIPLLMLFCGILIEGFRNGIENAAVRKAIGAVACVSLATMAWTTRPSPDVIHVFDWAPQSASRHIAAALSDIDPQRTWKIAWGYKGKFIFVPIEYYSRFGCKVIQANPDDCDVTIGYYPAPGTYGPSFYGPAFRDEFFQPYQCRVVLSPAIRQQYGL